MIPNTYPFYGQQVLGVDPELLNKLSKEYELMNTLHSLYYKVVETNPGERFIRFAKKNRRERPALIVDQKLSLTPSKGKSNKTEADNGESQKIELDSHLKVAGAFLKVKHEISINPRLLKFAELPILDRPEHPEIEEGNATKSRKTSFKV